MYTLSENSRKMMAHGVARATEVLQAAGAVEVQVNPLLRPAGWHLMGTARMGTHHANSVVDAYGRCHDVPTCLSSTAAFWSRGSSEPHLDNPGPALYIADHIKQNARHLRG